MRGATPSNRELGAGHEPGGDRSGRRRRHHPETSEFVVQRVDLEVAVEHSTVIDQHGGVLEGDRHAVGEADSLDAHDLGTVVKTKVGELLGTCSIDAGRDEPRRRLHAASRHLLGERQEYARPAVHRPRRDERPPAALAVDEAGDGQLLNCLADGHPADVEAGAQLGLRRQRVTGRCGSDQPAQVGLDLAIAGAAR